MSPITEENIKYSIIKSYIFTLRDMELMTKFLEDLCVMIGFDGYKFSLSQDKTVLSINADTTKTIDVIKENKLYNVLTDWIYYSEYFYRCLYQSTIEDIDVFLNGKRLH